MVEALCLNDGTLTLTNKASQEDSSTKKRQQFLNHGEPDQMEIEGYVFSQLKNRIVHLCYFLSFGMLRLLFHWYPQWHLKATHTISSLKDAEKVLIIDNYKGKYKSFFVKEVTILKTSDGDISRVIQPLLQFHLNDGTTKQLPQVRVIRCKKLTYVWDEEKGKFIKLAGLENRITHSDLHGFVGQSEEQQFSKRIIYGSNEIIVPVQTIMTLLLLEALTPFYMFQLFSLIVWFAEYYYYYTVAIIIMSVTGITTSIIQTRKNQKNLKGTVSSSCTTIVCRGHEKYEEVLTTELVPGDLIVISPQENQMQCDAVLLNGNCVVNESMLTGESVPITKTGIPNNATVYSVRNDVNHTLFCGTKIIQTRSNENEKILAVVIRTGYLTTKGELVRSILYPPPADFKFDQDSYKFIGILFVIAISGFIHTIVSKSSRNIEALDILIKALDLVTIAVPPALPAAMTVGKLYALNRLKNNKIYCINSRVINVSGSVDCICFDKTGTLTEDALDLYSVVPVEEGKLKPGIKDVKTLSKDSILLRGMACCHSLNIIQDKLCGDPLDDKMFRATGCSLTPVGSTTLIQDNSFSIEVLHQNQFSSHLQRMSVITKTSDQQDFMVFCKGAPEKIIELSQPDSVPEGILRELKRFTVQGYRVIALASKTLQENNYMSLPRDLVESQLIFAGLIVMENKLKPQTSGAIKVLKDANLKVVMVTGDNILTATHVARESKILDETATIIEVLANKPAKYDFATIDYSIVSHAQKQNNSSCADLENGTSRKYNFIITGPSWANLVDFFPDLVPKIVAKGVVFARMSGHQKQELVEELKNLGHYVAMCGDGANDCGALKAAHVGISLSEAESSVASPFTSKQPNIECVPKVIKEGRAALITSFGVFKLMLCYSLTEFASVIILYAIDSNLTSFQYLFIDIFLILNFASFFGKTKAYENLDASLPPVSLLSLVPLASIVMFMLTTVTFQIASFYYIQTFDWFTPFVFNPKNNLALNCYENYAIFAVSMFQYIAMAIVFSKGKPFRKPIYTNYYFTGTLILMTIFCAFIAVYPEGFLRELLELNVPPEYNGRIAVLLLGLVNFIVCVIIEDCLVENFIGKIVLSRLKINHKSKKYLNVLQELNCQSEWPRISSENAVILDKVRENGHGIVNNGFQLAEDIVTTKC